ncbi:MAG: enoyl-[acyl-carrier protein] reductase [Bacteroidota bacterium]|nr:enoyl-[acyl-carrier protein] reductase [Bacteroidota bacterium]
MNNNKQYALILGVSSGFGAATALELARQGLNIYGVHLDLGNGRARAEGIRKEIESYGVKAKFFNTNAADDIRRSEVLGEIRKDMESGECEGIKALIHSLAFGAIKPFIDENPDNRINRKNLDMTIDVMANSLVYWVQDVFLSKMFVENSRIIALSSVGSRRVMIAYGAMSAAKAAIESHVRQLAVELAKYKITVNALCPGVTDTPAAQKIPGFVQMLGFAKKHNPFKRNTQPEDVAKTISLLMDEKSYFITGYVIGADGGESLNMNFID